MKNKILITTSIVFSSLFFLLFIGYEGNNVSIVLVALSTLLSIYTYFSILRTYSSRRREAMEAANISMPCKVMVLFTEFKAHRERLKYGVSEFSSRPASANPPPLPSPPDHSNSSNNLHEKLNVLHQMNLDGLISDDEYAAKKAEILKRM